MTKIFKAKGKIWLYPGMGGWHFVTLSKNTKEEIDFYFREFKRGWGSLPVLVTIGKTSWKTSIFPDKKEDSYILPLKKEARKAESIGEGDNINFTLEIKLG